MTELSSYDTSRYGPEEQYRRVGVLYNEHMLYEYPREQSDAFRLPVVNGTN